MPAVALKRHTEIPERGAQDPRQEAKPRDRIPVNQEKVGVDTLINRACTTSPSVLISAKGCPQHSFRDELQLPEEKES